MRFAVIVIAAFLVACGQETRESQPLRHAGVVADVRLTIESGLKDTSSSGAGGAIVGGLIFGPVGAVAGYALTNETKIVSVTEATSCLAVVSVGTRRAIFSGNGTGGRWAEGTHWVRRCAVLRPEDRVWIEVVGRPMNIWERRGDLKFLYPGSSEYYVGSWEP